ncbi:histidine--tRNA ligase [Epibacterium sp. DP7N7-1]|nr:histidine--tRNA ligase [Epibacterium sp. DP7N7-1]
MSNTVNRGRVAGPKGFRDLRGQDLERRDRMVASILDVTRLYGCERLETPSVEAAGAIGSWLPDVDRPNAGVFAWEAEDERLALRFDLTAPLARFVVEQGQSLPLPWRRASSGPVWRNEKYGPGRFREFWQCDMDIVGSDEMLADVEIIEMFGRALLAAGLPADSLEIRIGSRLALDGLIEMLGSECNALVSGIARCIDKLDRLGMDGVLALLGEGRRDESGAFEAGLCLPPAKCALVRRFLEAGTLEDLSALIGDTRPGTIAVAQIQQAIEMVGDGAGIPLRVDQTVVRGLGYYTGLVFEAEVTSEIRDTKGRVRRVGSVGGGGRYDGLAGQINGRKIGAVGASVGIDRVLAILDLMGIQSRRAEMRPVLVALPDQASLTPAREMVRELRAVGIVAEVYSGSSTNLGRQLKYADRRGAALVLIQGEEERRTGRVQIKDLDMGAMLSDKVSREEWMARPQQDDVPRSDLVAEVLRRLQAGPVIDM